MSWSVVRRWVTGEVGILEKSGFPRWLQILCVLGLVAVVFAPTTRGQELEWRGFEEAVAAADSTDRFVLVAVYAPWCGWCRKMKTEVYPSDAVRRCLADDFVLTRLNRDDTETTYWYQGRRVTPRRLASTFRADEVPTTVLLSPKGTYMLHLSGFIEPRPLRSVLAYISTRAYRDTSYEDFRADPSDCPENGTAD